MNKLWLALPAALLMAAGCGESENTGDDVPVAPSTEERGVSGGGDENATDSEDVTAGESREFEHVRMSIPENWQEAEMSPMQRTVLMAKYVIPDVHEDLEVTFSAATGGIDANFDRWKGQFSGGTEQEETVDFDTSSARVLKLTGNWTPGFGRPNRTEWMMYGAALPGTERAVYIKLTGPVDKVLEIDDAVEKMIARADIIVNP